jgi:hypothetical protein
MCDHSLRSLLPRGTKTWQNGNRETTIGLILASEELASTVAKCIIHETEHGSDHQAIETTFDIATPERTTEPRLLFKNAPWTAVRARIATALRPIPVQGNVQQQTDRLMTVVLEAVQALTPEGQTAAIREKVVDNRSYATPPDVHTSQEPGKGPTSSGLHTSRLRAAGEVRRQRIP